MWRRGGGKLEEFFLYSSPHKCYYNNLSNILICIVYKTMRSLANRSGADIHVNSARTVTVTATSKALFKVSVCKAPYTS